MLALNCTPYANAQIMYRCGTTYSQTPCGVGQKEIEVKVDDPCENEASKYSSKCIMRPAKPYSSKPSAAEVKRQADSLALDKQRAQDRSRWEAEKAEAEKKTFNQRVQESMDKAQKKAIVVPELLPDAATIAKSKALCTKTAIDQLKDPESARITEMQRVGARNVELSGGAWTVRILYQMNINAKNSYGGYEGKKLWQCDFTPGEKELKDAYPLG